MSIVSITVDLLAGRINLFHPSIACIFQFWIKIAIFFNDSDGSLEMADFGSALDPIEVDSLYFDIVKCDRHITN